VNGLGLAHHRRRGRELVSKHWHERGDGARHVPNLIAGALGGILVPLTLDRWKIDPAVSSSAFVTTVTDVVGYGAFLSIATCGPSFLSQGGPRPRINVPLPLRR